MNYSLDSIMPKKSMIIFFTLTLEFSFIALIYDLMFATVC